MRLFKNQKRGRTKMRTLNMEKEIRKFLTKIVLFLVSFLQKKKLIWQKKYEQKWTKKISFLLHVIKIWILNIITIILLLQIHQIQRRATRIVIWLICFDSLSPFFQKLILLKFLFLVFRFCSKFWFTYYEYETYRFTYYT